MRNPQLNRLTHTGKTGELRPLAELVRQSSRRAALEAIRDRLALELDEAHGRDVAPLAKQLADVIREIDSLPTPSGASRLDEIKRRDRGEDSADL